MSGPSQDMVDHAAGALVELLRAMAEAAREGTEQRKWDEEYAGHAVNDCLDRLFCAPEAGAPRPSDRVGAAYAAAYDLAAPYLTEDVPLPGSLEEDVAAREERLWSERWPEFQGQEKRLHPEIAAAIHFEALRDAQAERA